MRKALSFLMEDEADEDSEEGGAGSGVLAFILGLLTAVFCGVFVQGQDVIASLLVVAGFAAIILYSEFQLTLASGVSFGIGLTMTSFASSNWALLVVSVAAVIVSLGRYSIGDASMTALEPEETSPEPVLGSD